MQQLFYHRIWRNKSVVISCLVIIVATLLAIFAYIVSPDNTSNANRQNLLLALKSPVFGQQSLVRVKNINQEDKNVVTSAFSGYSDYREYIPYDSISNQKGEIIIHYQGRVRVIEVMDLLYPLRPGSKATKDVAGNYIGELHNGILVKQSREEIEKLIEERRVTQYFWLGTDKFGRDNLSRLILGLRVSLIVGFLAVLVSLIIGVLIGSLTGYFGGYVDKVGMLVINTAWSIPTLLLAFAIIISFGKGLMTIILAIGLTMWVDVARIVRGQVLQIKNQLYVKATNVLGLPHSQIILRHILPNIIGPILVIAAANFATAILVEAGLSFLGIGIQPPAPSLGTILKENYAYTTGGFVYLAVFPIITIMILVLSFNMLGTGLRDVFDIKTDRT